MFTYKTQKFIRFGVNILRKRIDLKTEFKVEYYINSIFMCKRPKPKERRIAFSLKTEEKNENGKIT